MEGERRTIGGRYELRALIATGGMGQVWRGRDVLLGRPVAVKVLRSEYTGDRTFRARFRAEAQHAALLAHRNIAAVHDYGEVADDGSGERLAYLVMELVEGEPLSDLLARAGRLSVPRTLDVLRQTAAALAAAHASGVVHRDVKPGNVLLGDDGVVKITDFGIAWSAADVPLTQTGQVVGTAHYLSPEQAAGAKAGPASDVYALGMIGYECLAGRRAFDGDNPLQIALRQISDVPEPLPPDVPDGVRTLVARALVKDPAARLPDGAAFVAAVEDVLAGRPLPPPPAGSPTTSPLWLLSGLPEVPAGRRRLGHHGMRGRVLAPLLALAAGAALGVGALELLGGGGPVPAGAVRAAAPAATTGTDAVLDAADYVGRPVAQVQAELTGLGLVVRLAPAPAPATAVPDGQVTAISPVGTLGRGETVTVIWQPAGAGSTPAPATPAPGPAETATGALPVVAVAPPAAPSPATPRQQVGSDDGAGGHGAGHPGHGGGPGKGHAGHGHG